MKKIMIGVAVVAFVLLAILTYPKVTGMATIKYDCVDNDFSATKAIQVRGVVTVTSTAGDREIYTDSCLNNATLREYSCNHNNNRQMYSDYDCPCLNGRCDE